MRHPSRTSTKVQGKTSREQLRVRPYISLGTALLISLTSLSLFSQTPQMNSGAAAPIEKKSSSHSANQASRKTADPDLAGLQEVLKNPELLKEIGELFEKVQKGVQYPAARNQSRILAKLPQSTMFYAAFPNYGESAHQAAQIFKEELEKSPQIKAFLSKQKLDTLQTQVEDGFQKFYEFSEFLGDEVVIAGRMEGKEPTGVMVAEIKKPGLAAYLDRLNRELFTKPGDRLRIFDPQQLAAASDKEAGKAPAVLVRQDFVAIGLSVQALREFNSQVEHTGADLTSSALGERLAQSYQRGTSTVWGLDLHQLVGMIPANKPEDRAILEKTGFTDVSYLVSESTLSAAGSSNRFELSFQRPRRGIASWIAAPAPMDGLDFVSSHPALAVAVILKNPALMLDDLREMLGERAFASLAQMEERLHLNLKQDILAKLSGEVVLEMQSPFMGMARPAQSTFDDAPAPLKPGPFKVILRVTDPDGLQRALTGLLATAPAKSGQYQEDGVTLHTLTFPSAGDSVEINYFFLDGYLVIASNRAVAKEALRAHRSGDSLAKSVKLRSALASAESQNASILVYQDTGSMLSAMMAQMPQELRELISAGGQINAEPTVASIIADERSFHGGSNNSSRASGATVMTVAAIAIPALIRSRGEISKGSHSDAGNEFVAVSSVRTLNTAEVTYSTSYPANGFASSLAALGPVSDGSCADQEASAEHACLIDNVLANPTCTTGRWCAKGGYKFAIRGTCMSGRCLHYVVTATPADAGAIAKSFCSTDDAVIRSHSGAPPAAALTFAECRTWKPLE